MSGHLRPYALLRELAACVQAHWRGEATPAAPKRAAPQASGRVMASEPGWEAKFLARVIAGVRESYDKGLGLYAVSFRLNGRKYGAMSIYSTTPMMAVASGASVAEFETEVSERDQTVWTVGWPNDCYAVESTFHSAWSGAGLGVEYYRKREWHMLSEVLGRLGYFERRLDLSKAPPEEDDELPSVPFRPGPRRGAT